VATTTRADERREVLDIFEAIEEIGTAHGRVTDFGAGLVDHAVLQDEAPESLMVAYDEIRDGTLAGRLSRVTQKMLGLLPPIPVAVAAELLRLSAPTVRRWTEEGVLVEVDGDRPVMQLDPHRVYEVWQLVRDLRLQGAKPGHLMEQVWWRLADKALLSRDDLRDSLEQMRRGEVVEA